MTNHLHDIDLSSSINIQAVLCIRNMISTLTKIMEYELCMPHITALSNAVFSQSIDYIQKETQAIERKYLANNNSNFDVHPLEHLSRLVEKGDDHVEAYRVILRKLMNASVANAQSITTIDTWLLGCPLSSFREVAKTNATHNDVIDIRI